MAKWCGKIGFADSVEYEAGCWENGIVERLYRGDVLSNRWKRQNTGGVNNDINLSNQISIVSDPYAVMHCSAICYVEYLGTLWSVTEVDPQWPRLVLTVGGVYHGNTTGTTG